MKGIWDRTDQGHCGGLAYSGEREDDELKRKIEKEELKRIDKFIKDNDFQDIADSVDNILQRNRK